MESIATDTIVAIATAAGAGGVGMLRLSGPRAAAIATALGAPPLRPRHAHYARLRDADGLGVHLGAGRVRKGVPRCLGTFQPTVEIHPQRQVRPSRHGHP